VSCLVPKKKFADVKWGKLGREESPQIPIHVPRALRIPPIWFHDGYRTM